MKAILIDDELLALNYLEYQLSSLGSLHIIGTYTDPLAGMAAINKSDVDVVFLDIQIPEWNGLELAERLLESRPNLNVIFVTAYEEYAIKAFELNALDYVLKPVTRGRLQKTIARLPADPQQISPAAFAGTQRLYVSLFQQVTLATAEQPAAPLRWRTAKAQQLFLYLLQHREQTVNKTTFIDLLWPELDADKAYQQLYTSIYYIRKTLASYGSHFPIRSSAEGYTLSLRQVDLDVDRFEQFVRASPPLSRESIAQHEQMLNLVKGDYLQEYDYVWAESERHRLQLQWVQLALNMMRWYKASGEPNKALLLGLDLCRRCPLEEEAYLLVMQLFAAMGKHSAVVAQYQLLEEVMRRELQIPPAPDVRVWMRQWEQRRQEED